MVSSFEEACKSLVRDESYDRKKFLNFKKDKIPLITLKRQFKPIAVNYIPHTIRSGTTGFPAELIVKISVLMGVYVTDITTLAHKR